MVPFRLALARKPETDRGGRIKSFPPSLINMVVGPDIKINVWESRVIGRGFESRISTRAEAIVTTSLADKNAMKAMAGAAKDPLVAAAFAEAINVMFRAQDMLKLHKKPSATQLNEHERNCREVLATIIPYDSMTVDRSMKLDLPEEMALMLGAARIATEKHIPTEDAGGFEDPFDGFVEEITRQVQLMVAGFEVSNADTSPHWQFSKVIAGQIRKKAKNAHWVDGLHAYNAHLPRRAELLTPKGL